MVPRERGSVDELFTRNTFPDDVPMTTPAPGTTDAADSTYAGY